MSKIGQRLDLKQGQSLVMTPQLQQAIKLLQMSNQELSAFIESEVAQNPLLEKKEGEDTPSESQEAENPPAEERDEFEDNYSGDFDAGSSMANIGAGGSRSFDTMDESFENSLKQEQTLRDHLLQQLHMTCEDSRDRMVGGLLIDQLDEAGYLRADPAELAERLACPAERVENLLETLRGFNPAGVFARDLKDCLALQLKDQGKMDAPMKILLDNLALLADHNHSELARKCAVNETYLQDMVSDIRALNPKPAANFDHMTVQTAIPDVLMKRLPKHVGGGWRVELNAETLPRVLINQEYFTEVSNRTKNKKDTEYLNNQMASANWLVRALDQRAQTILKVAAEIIEHQDGFFLYGIEFLKPLTLKDVADAIQMHESTVSRVTTNKYIGTPRGIFELKYFFTNAIAATDGGASHSAESVKARIKSMIDSESPDAILSDDAIVDALQKDGIDIARRTVAKYREGMHIASSVQRRRQKKSSTRS